MVSLRLSRVSLEKPSAPLSSHSTLHSEGFTVILTRFALPLCTAFRRSCTTRSLSDVILRLALIKWRVCLSNG